MPPHWSAEFFRGPIVELWRGCVPVEQTRLEADFLERELRLRPAQHVLDVPCGHGRHAIELATRGYRLTGLDGSDEMLAAARESATAAGVDVEWRLADMREIAAEAAFDAAYCFGNSFGYLDRDGMGTFLAAVSRALRPGARFAFDCGLAAECILPRFTEREWAPVGDWLFLESNRYDLDESCVETTYTLLKDGVADVRVGRHWVYTIREIRSMLRDAGLEPHGLSRSLHGEPFSLGSPLLIGVAEKV